MGKFRFSNKQMREVGRDRVMELLRNDPLFAREVVEDKNARLFSFRDGRNWRNHLVRLALHGNDKLAVEIIGRKDLREAICVGGVMLAQISVENSAQARIEALKNREAYLLPAISSSPFVKYVAHVCVSFKDGASFAIGVEDLCSLENKNSGSLADYIRIAHKDTVILQRMPTDGKRSTEMVWGRNGDMHY
jgi:translation initiation factor IF-1